MGRGDRLVHGPEELADDALESECSRRRPLNAVTVASAL